MLEFIRCHNFAAEIELIKSAIVDRPESAMFSLAEREYQFSLYAAATGSYRHAHISLRLFFELILASIFFSAYEIKLRNWLSNSNDSDIRWATIADAENGVYSRSFLSAFHPGLEDSGKQYLTIASKTYRECSEYVHGNIHTHIDADHPLAYDRVTLQAWVGRVDAMRLSIVFAFAGRYLLLLDAPNRNKLEGPLVENLGHLPAIQQAYS